MDRKRVLVIFGIAWVSAALLTWFLYAQTKGPKRETTIPTVAALHDMPTGTRLKKSDLKIVRVSDKDVPRSALTDPLAALDRVLLYPVSANETLTNVKLTSPSRAEGIASTIDPGMRAVSIAINDANGVAGLVQPRSHVDVLFTRPGSMAEAVTTTILEDAVVLSVGRSADVATGTLDPKAPRPQNQAATILVTPEDARKVELAKNQGKVSLALRNPLDHDAIAAASPTRAEALNVDPYPRGGRKPAPAPNVRDPAVWAKITGDKPKKEPEEKPRLVVDVYRGDKHVQEIFP